MLPLARAWLTQFNALQAQVAYDESLLAVGVMLDRPGFGWHVLLGRLAGGRTFAEAIPNFGFVEDLRAGSKVAPYNRAR